MLREIIDVLESEITALEWVEVYGGLATRYPLNVEGSIRYLPIRCGLSMAVCMEQGKYAELHPDSKKKSLLFWEPLGRLDIQYEGKRTNLVRGSARLVVWLNLQALGHADQCSVAAQAAIELMGIIEGHRSINSGPLSGSNVTFRPVSLPTREPEIFGRYDFGESTFYTMHPFDYFAIDVDFEGAFCLSALTLGSEFDCLY